MQTKAFALSVSALLFSAGAVSAASVTDIYNLNLRSGPGINYDVIGTMPAGSDIRVLRCSHSWCRVAWNGTSGFASREFISSGGPVYAASPVAPVAVAAYGSYGYAQSDVGYGRRYNRWNR